MCKYDPPTGLKQRTQEYIYTSLLTYLRDCRRDFVTEFGKRQQKFFVCIFLTVSTKFWSLYMPLVARSRLTCNNILDSVCERICVSSFDCQVNWNVISTNSKFETKKNDRFIFKTKTNNIILNTY